MTASRREPCVYLSEVCVHHFVCFLRNPVLIGLLGAVPLMYQQLGGYCFSNWTLCSRESNKFGKHMLFFFLSVVFKPCLKAFMSFVSHYTSCESTAGLQKGSFWLLTDAEQPEHPPGRLMSPVPRWKLRNKVTQRIKRKSMSAPGLEFTLAWFLSPGTSSPMDPSFVSLWVRRGQGVSTCGKTPAILRPLCLVGRSFLLINCRAVGK